jgi:thioesterase domain-containing protein
MHEVPEDRDFLELGMDSLTMNRVLVKLRRDLQLSVFAQEMFDHPSVAALSRYLAREMEPDRASARDGRVAGPRAVLQPAGPGSLDVGDALPGERVPGPVFVLSSPRSGSTLLRVMLAGHSRLLSPPELHLLPFETMGERARSLGEGQKKGLGEGLVRVLMELRGIDAEASGAMVRRWAEEDLPVQAVYRRLHDMAEGRLVVDKSPSYVSRLATLLRAEALFEGARYVQLVRHPYAVIESIVRNRMHRMTMPDGFAARPAPDRRAGVGARQHEHVDVPARRPARAQAFDPLRGYGRGPGARHACALHIPGHPLRIRDPRPLPRGPHDRRRPPRVQPYRRPELSHPRRDRPRPRRGVDQDPAPAATRPPDPPDRRGPRLRAAVRPAPPRARPALVAADNELQPHGRGTPFFCVPGLEGSALALSPLAQHLGQDRPCFGLHDDGLAGAPRIEDTAARYIAAVRGAQPDGPYLLGGWSFGGVVAFEMARQLTRDGHRVGFVAMLDTRAVHAAKPTPEEPAEAADRRMTTQLLTSLARGHDLPIEDLHPFGSDPQLAPILKLLQDVHLLAPTASVADARRLLAALTARLRAKWQYAPPLPPYPGPLVLFRARERRAEEPADASPTLGWSAFSSQPVTVYDVPGNHFTMLRAPHVQDLASQLRRCLRTADPRVTP